MERKIKNEKTINNFLQDLPQLSQIGHSIEEGDLARHLTNKSKKFGEDKTILDEFVAAVKLECIVDSLHFNFYDIPDMIVKKKYTRENYEKIKKLILKVKTIYLQKKADKLKEGRIR